MRLLLGPGRRPGDGLGGRGARADVALDQPGLPDDRAAPAGGAPGARRARARASRPRRVVSEADLFLRLCPAPTIGVTGTKGKTTTSSLTAALLAADPSHPVVLGGNIGDPARRAAAGADAGPPRRRSSSRSSSCRRCRAARPSRSTRTSPPTTSTGTARWRPTARSSGGSRSSSIRPARSSSTPTTRSSPAYADLGTAPVASTGERPAGRRRRRPRLDRRRRRATAADAGGGDGGGRAAAAGSCPSTSSRSRARHNVSNALAAVAVALLFGVAPEAIRRAAAAFEGVEHRLERVATSTASASSTTRRARSRTRSSRRCAPSIAPIVLIAGGRDKGVDLAGSRPVVAERAAAAVLIGESGPALERAVPRGRPRARPSARRRSRRPSATADALARERCATPAGRAPRPCCSARPRRASTCSRTTRPAAGRSRRRSARLGDERAGGPIERRA